MSAWTVGSVWEETRAIVRAQAWVFAPIAAAFVLLPNLIVARFFPTRSPFEAPDTQTLLAQLVLALVSVVAEAAILIIALRRDQGRSVGEIIGDAIRLTPALFAMKILIAVAGGIGLLLLILPGIYIVCRLAPSAPAMIDERRGIVDSLRRGWELGGSHVLRIFLFYALIIVATIGAIFLLSVVAMAVGVVLRLVGIPGVDQFLFLLTVAVVFSAVTVYAWTGIAVIYRHIARG
jgi:hypothetical protein